MLDSACCVSRLVVVAGGTVAMSNRDNRGTVLENAVVGGNTVVCIHRDPVCDCTSDSDDECTRDNVERFRVLVEEPSDRVLLSWVCDDVVFVHDKFLSVREKMK